MTVTACGASVQCCAIRVATLDANGKPFPGPGNLYCTDAMSILTVTPIYSAEIDIEVEDQAGVPQVLTHNRQALKRFDTTLELLNTDPDLEAILTGGATIVQGGLSVGVACPPVGLIGAFNGVSVELWSKHVVNGEIDPVWPYVWWVIPRCYWQSGGTKLGNYPSTQTYTGIVVENPAWGAGPFGDWVGDSSRPMEWMLSKRLPAAACGLQQLPQSSYHTDQSGTARLRSITTRPIPGQSAIRGTRTAAQTAVAKIGSVLSIVQTGTANIAGLQSALPLPAVPPGLLSPAAWRQTGPVAGAAPSAALTSPQPATARIVATVVSAQTGTARIVASVHAAQSAAARVAIVGTRTQPAVARISGRVVSSVLAVAQIAPNSALVADLRPFDALPPGLGSPMAWRQPSINVPLAGAGSTAQTGIARIVKTAVAVQSGITRIQLAPTHTNQSGVTRIATTGTNVQSGIVRVRTAGTATQLAVARIQSVSTATQAGRASIVSAGQMPSTLVADLKPFDALPPGMISPMSWRQPRPPTTIAPSPSSSQPGKARLTATAKANQSAVANIKTGGWSLIQNLKAIPASRSDGLALTVSAAFAGNVTAGNRIFVFTSRWSSNGSNCNTPTDSQGNIYTQLVAGHLATTNLLWGTIWTATVATTGALTITVVGPAQSAGNANILGWTAQEYSGLSAAAGAGCLDVSAVGVFNTFNTNNADSGTTPASHAVNQLGLTVVVDDAAGGAVTWTLAIANGFVKVAGASIDANTIVNIAVANKVSANAATENANWTNGHITDDDGALVAVIKLGP